MGTTKCSFYPCLPTINHSHTKGQKNSKVSSPQILNKNAVSSPHALPLSIRRSKKEVFNRVYPPPDTNMPGIMPLPYQRSKKAVCSRVYSPPKIESSRTQQQAYLVVPNHSPSHSRGQKRQFLSVFTNHQTQLGEVILVR